MEVPKKKRKQKSCRKHPKWDPFSFFLLISFPFAFILSIILISLNIKTIFWSDGTWSFRRPRGYVGVCFFLCGYISFFLALFYVICFLLKTIKEKPARRKTATGYLLTFFGDQLLTIFSFFVLLIRKKEGGGWIMLPLFCLITLNGFFIHYFFSKPVMKLLYNQYPCYFPIFFSKGSKYDMRWPLAITLLNVNLQLLFLLGLIFS